MEKSNLKKILSSKIKPVVNNDYIFLVTKNNLLIALNIKKWKNYLFL